jgi:hypothetical protein
VPRDYLWDSQAAAKVESEELDKLYETNKKHYDVLARELWERLRSINERPIYLKHDDLYDALLPVITRDGVTLRGMSDRHLPEPLARGAAQWFAWFTHYVVEQYLAQVGDEE